MRWLIPLAFLFGTTAHAQTQASIVSTTARGDSLFATLSFDSVHMKVDTIWKTDTLRRVDTVRVPVLGSSVGTWSSVCQSRTGPLVTLMGSQPRYDSRVNPVPLGTRIDAAAARWEKVSNFTVNFSHDGRGCWTGGKIISPFDTLATWDTYHSSAGVLVYGPDAVVEGVRIVNFGDGIRFTPTGTKNWTLRGVWIDRSGDDCVENDRLEAGLIDDVLFDGCYQAFSARPGLAFVSQVNGSQRTVTVKGSLVRVGRQVGVYKGTSPGSGGFFKIENNLPAINVKWVLEDNIFRLDAPPTLSVGTACLNPRNVVKQSARNIMVWLGQGDYPCLPLPAGWTLTRDKGVWDAAVAAWKARHPTVQ